MGKDKGPGLPAPADPRTQGATVGLVAEVHLAADMAFQAVEGLGRDPELIGLRFHSATWGITYPDGRVIQPAQRG